MVRDDDKTNMLLWHISNLFDGGVPSSEPNVLSKSALHHAGAADQDSVSRHDLRSTGATLAGRAFVHSSAEAANIHDPPLGLCAREELERNPEPTDLLGRLHCSRLSRALWYDTSRA